MSHDHNASLSLSRRRLLQGGASLAASSLLSGCGYSANRAYVPAARFPLPTPSGPVVQGSLTVTATPGGVIPPRFMGLSYEKLALTYPYFHVSNHNLIGLFRRLGDGVLRIGGGSVDQVLWTPDNKGSHARVTPPIVRALAGFLEATNWRSLYGVNLATSTPALAAEEVAYVVAALGSNLLGIELGNEPDEYGVAGHVFAGNWTFPDFLARWELFRSAIVQAAPHVPITGPATGGGDHITTWTQRFGQSATRSEIVLLTQHYYRASGGDPSSTASFLVSPDAQLSTELTTMGAVARQLDVPYRISECSSFYDGGAPGVSDSYASSLWALDFLFSVAAEGATGVNLHGGGNGPGYTPIADDSGGVIEARPEYYGLLFFVLAGPGTLMATQLSVGSVNASAYAVRAANGGLNVMLINKDELRNLTITIETNQEIHSATQQMMSGPGLAATSGVTIQGATVNPDGSFGPANPDTLTPSGTRTTCYIPALCAALVKII